MSLSRNGAWTKPAWWNDAARRIVPVMTALAANPDTSTPPKPLRAGLWAAQIVLALAFAAAGSWKATAPIADLTAKLPWVAGSPEALVRFIGASELAGALGLILPAATRIKPWLTPLAAAALALVMVLALGLHASRGEWAGIPPNVVLGGLAAFVAWGRARKAPITPR